jgi:hypothetical protein
MGKHHSRRLGSYLMAPSFTITVFWLDGTSEHIQGSSLGEALNDAGYSNGSIHEIAFVSNGQDDRWHWNGEVWVLKVPTK